MEPRTDAPLEPPTTDRLGVLTGSATVLRQTRMVWLDAAAADQVAAEWAATPWPSTPPFTERHLSLPPEQTANWVLLLDALNFCFWGEPGQPRWRVAWHGEVLDGYDALAAALSRAVVEGHPVYDAAYLTALTEEKLAYLLRPAEGSPQIPLFEARLAHAREVGRVLLQTYDGQFAHVIAAAQQSAVALALLLVREFPSFQDVAPWRGGLVPFYKRAQICVADLHAAYDGTGLGTFHDLADLTAFADYKIPQLLRHAGVLHYAPDLAAQVDAQRPLAAASEAEVAIRAGTVWGVELLRRALAERGVARSASEIDARLWYASQRTIAAIAPYHRSRTTAY